MEEDALSILTTCGTALDITLARLPLGAFLAAEAEARGRRRSYDRSRLEGPWHARGKVVAVPADSPAAVAMVPVKPLLRGWLHFVCFFLALPVGGWLVATAVTTEGRIGAVVYSLGLAALFGVSGLYHRGRWSPTWRRRMSRLDHSTIFVMIAGSYTPICLVVVRGTTSMVLLAAVWTGATLGAVLAWRSDRASAVISHALYIVLGWLVILAGPQLIRVLTTRDLRLLVAGGALFTIGAISLGRRWPDPFPACSGTKRYGTSLSSPPSPATSSPSAHCFAVVRREARGGPERTGAAVEHRGGGVDWAARSRRRQRPRREYPKPPKSNRTMTTINRMVSMELSCPPDGPSNLGHGESTTRRGRGPRPTTTSSPRRTRR